ncbi:MAG: MBL fold metallo-hydrolase [Candidatus Odinarchaeia archaeon]
MKIIFLGTNGWYDTKTGNTICTLIETRKHYIVLDAGNGLYKLDQYIRSNSKPIYLFLSHFHIDHIEGLHILNKFNFRQGITIYGPRGVKKFLNIFINSPFTKPLKELVTPVRIRELHSVRNTLSFLKSVEPLEHQNLCIGFRFEFERKIVSYCVDTGVCDNLFKLAYNADILIAEASLKKKNKTSAWAHLTPIEASTVARKSKVKFLFLTHFDASVYKSLKERQAQVKNAKRIFPNIKFAKDDMEITM